MEEILIVRGTSGVGKSSIGKLLGKHFENGVTIEIDDIRSMVNSVNWTDMKEYFVAIEATRNLTLAYLKFNYSPIIIIDTFGQDRVKMVTDFLPRGTGYRIISLVATEEVINERISKRTKPFISFGPNSNTNLSVLPQNSENNLIINTTDLSIEETFNTIIKDLN